jgi:hypothetical protein
MLPMALLVTLNPDSLEIWYKPLKGERLGSLLFQQ